MFKEYREEKLSVIPLVEKRAFLPEWSKYCAELPLLDVVEEWEEKFSNHNLGLCCGEASKIVCLDVDLDFSNESDNEIYKKIEHLIPTSPIEKIGKKGFTRFYRYEGESSEKFNYYDENGNRQLVVELLSNGNQTVIPPSIHPETQKPYYYKNENTLLSFDTSTLPMIPVGNLKELREVLERNKGKQVDNDSTTPNSTTSGRNNKLKEIAAASIYNGDEDFAVAKKLVVYDQSNHSPPLFSDCQESQMRSKTPEQNALLFTQNIRKTIGIDPSEMKKGAHKTTCKMSSKWPSPISSEAYIGVAGDFINTIDGKTEADTNATLVQFLTIVGSVVGRSASFQIGPNHHYTNLFSVIVGESAYARKGTSFGAALYPFEKEIFSDKYWAKNCKKTGLSSGEGLMQAIKSNLDPMGEPDEGEFDNRLLSFESEFGGVLRKMCREGNTLSATLRSAWDDGNIATMTRAEPISVEDAHISLIGHITEDELRKELKESDKTNGLGNRILWTCAKRSKKLPFAEPFENFDFSEIIGKLNDAIKFSKTIGRVELSSEAAEYWTQLYLQFPELPGTYGTMIARGTAHILRLALIYTVLDTSKKVDVRHLKAANAVWTFCQESCLYLFGRDLNDRYANALYEKLQDCPDGLTRTEIRDFFSKNRSKEQIEETLSILKEYDLAEKVIEPGSGSKKIERWVLKCFAEKSLSNAA